MTGMNFEYSQEQLILQQSVQRLLSGHECAMRESGGVGSIWSAYARLGLPSINIPEAYGGLGLGPIENAMVMRQVGKELCTAPFLASAIYGTILFELTATADQKASFYPALIDGSARLAVAHDGSSFHSDWKRLPVSAAPHGAGYFLNGQVARVFAGVDATHILVCASLAEAEDESDCVAVFIVPRSVNGLSLTPRRTIDSRNADLLTLTAVYVPAQSILASGRKAADGLAIAAMHATVGCINETVGAMEELLYTTVDYLKMRRQFDMPISAFQALRHRAVDSLVEVEQAKSMAIYATMQLGAPQQTRENGVAASKLFVNRAARIVAETAVQLHGAIGMTIESKPGRLFNRLTACQLMFGESQRLLSRMLETTPSILAN